MISVTKNGRRNCYRIHKKQPLRHKLEADCKIRDLIKVVARTKKPADSTAAPIDMPKHAGCHEPGPIKSSVDSVPEPESMKSSVDSVPEPDRKTPSQAAWIIQSGTDQSKSTEEN